MPGNLQYSPFKTNKKESEKRIYLFLPYPAPIHYRIKMLLF